MPNRAVSFFTSIAAEKILAGLVIVLAALAPSAQAGTITFGTAGDQYSIQLTRTTVANAAAEPSTPSAMGGTTVHGSSAADTFPTGSSSPARSPRGCERNSERILSRQRATQRRGSERYQFRPKPGTASTFLLVGILALATSGLRLRKHLFAMGLCFKLSRYRLPAK
jgi:hypothetical protein